MTAQAGTSRSWRVGRFTCTLTVLKHPQPSQGLKSVCEWVPYQPDELTDRQRLQWERGRHKAVRSLQRELGQDEDGRP